MSCNHIDDTFADIYYVCKEVWEEEGCDYEGTIEVSKCTFQWLLICPHCKKEKENEYL